MIILLILTIGIESVENSSFKSTYTVKEKRRLSIYRLNHFTVGKTSKNPSALKL